MMRCRWKMVPIAGPPFRIRGVARGADRRTTKIELGRVEKPNEWRTRLGREGEAPAIVALGKFDAMHVGHRALATAAAEMGHPWLVSFSGMAEIMGWDRNRLPLVADVERPFVLGTWKEVCHGLIPHMRYLPFGQIRHQSPREFVEMLARDLGAAGVVAGTNYRFGYQASGDAPLLKELAQEFGLSAQLVDLVHTDQNSLAGKVSSSKVRDALSTGDMRTVDALLGRPYTVLLQKTSPQDRLSLQRCPSSCILNQPPANGQYSVEIDSQRVVVEFDNEGVTCASFASTEFDGPVKLKFSP